MADSSQQRAHGKPGRSVRRDPPEFDPASLWKALSMTPGVGVSIMDTEGALVFVNDTSQLLFFNRVGVDYRGKTVHDFHPPGFCRERIDMIRRVIAEQKPLVIKHIYYGRRIESTIWPINDKKPPFNRVVVITHNQATGPLAVDPPNDFETIETRFIGLGPLDVLTQRELEVLVLLGHGMNVPAAAAALHRSPNTVQRHKEAISRKLSLSGQAELVALVASMGLELDHAHLERYGD